LAAGGVAYDELPVYRTQYRSGGRAADIVRGGRCDYVLFTSASTVRGFARCLPDIDFAAVHAVCIGEPTAQAAEALGMRVTVAPRATADGLCEALIRLKQEGHKHGI
jgi:Uroporphyrinogen-III synthase